MIEAWLMVTAHLMMATIYMPFELYWMMIYMNGGYDGAEGLDV